MIMARDGLLGFDRLILPMKNGRIESLVWHRYVQCTSFKHYGLDFDFSSPPDVFLWSGATKENNDDRFGGERWRPGEFEGRA